MNTKYRFKTSKPSCQQLLTPDVIITRLDSEDVDSILIVHPASVYRHYVRENLEAIGYVAYHGWQNEGRGFVVLIPLWENEHPELAVMYVSAANIFKLPLLEPLSENSKRFPRWYIKLAELVQVQIQHRINNYDPESEVVVLGQVEDTSKVFPDEQIYQQIRSIEIFNFRDFELSVQSCYKQFKNRACEFIV